MKTVCLVGCGHISKKHLMTIKELENVRLAGVADVDNAKAQCISQEMKCNAYNDYKQMIHQEKPDVIHLCVPHYLHYEMCEYAMKKNINIIIEKPGALSSDEFKRLLETQKQTKGITAVMYQNRLNNSVIKAKEIIDSGEYGDIIGCTANILWKRERNYYLLSEWHASKKQAGGGVLLTQGIHTIDLIRYLLGEVIDAKCIRGNLLYKDIEVEDSAIALLKLKKEISCILVATVANCCNIPAELTIYMENATLKVSGEQLYIKRTNSELWKCIVTDMQLGADRCYGRGHNKFIKKFYVDVDKGKTLLPSLMDAYLNFNILDKLYHEKDVAHNN